MEGVKNATNEQDLANRFKEFGKEMVKLNYVAARRQQVSGSLCSVLERRSKPLPTCVSQGFSVGENSYKFFHTPSLAWRSVNIICTSTRQIIGEDPLDYLILGLILYEIS